MKKGINKTTLASYTGLFSIINETPNQWYINFITSGVATFVKECTVDVFLVGGGGGGSLAAGGGGYTETHTINLQPNVPYTLIIGAGGIGVTEGIAGNGGITSGFGYFVNGGMGANDVNGGNGGSGGAGYNNASGGVNGSNGLNGTLGIGGIGQHSSTAAFDLAKMQTYAAGGSLTIISNDGAGNIIEPNATINTGSGGSKNGIGGSGVIIIRNRSDIA